MVLLGVPDYADPALIDVPQVRRNVVDLQAVLTDPRLGGFAPRHCQVAPWRASVAEVGRLLRTAADEAEDLLLFYYSGHGLLSALRRELHLSVHDTEHDQPSFTALAYHAVRDAWVRSRAGSRVVILDCCFSGRAIGDTLANLVDVVIEQVGVTGTYTLAASAGSSTAMVLGTETHTAFTGRLLDLLRTGVPDAGDVLDLGTLYRHLHARMLADGLPPPQQRGTENADRLGLVRNRQRGTPVADGAADADLHTMAVAYDLGEAGDRAVAVRLYQRVLPRLEAALGADHPRTLAARFGLAHNVAESGDRTTARRLYLDLLPDLIGVVGPAHPAVLDGRRRLAFHTGLDGDLDEAIRLYEELLCDEDPLPGDNLPHDDQQRPGTRPAEMAWARRQLAFFVGERGDHATAVDLYRRAIATMMLVLGPEDAETLEARAELAYHLELDGDQDAALRSHRELLPVLTQVVGAESESVARSAAAIRRLSR
jgi:hypothetical protein